ncbi:MAG: DNA-directed RNA polymerase subunit omega [Acidimicrobiales bacterium]|mgnify:FL=1|nr:DNA-directed RNA polymerase subunit omega [Acidimicrobiales bacterium]
MNHNDSLVNPAIEGLLETAESKFRLVTVSAKRARQINSYFGQLGEGLGSSIPPQVTSTSRKPLSIAFEELAAGKIQPIEPPEEVEEVDAIDADLAGQAADDLPSGEARVDGEEGA